MKLLRLLAPVLLGAMSLGGCATHMASTPPPNDLRLYGNPTIELTSVHYAIEKLGAAQAAPAHGAIPALYAARGDGMADLAGHAEIQALQHSLAHPDLRIILTLSEGHYRIVARRSAGIQTMADLRGKTIVTPRASSAAYYLTRALSTVGLTNDDVKLVDIPMPPKGIADMLAQGKADAVALWEPEPQLAVERLGKDAVILDPDISYREFYNLNTTAAKLADPATRAKIVRFVARLIEASRAMDTDRETAIALAARGTGYTAEAIRPIWTRHAFTASLSPRLLDVMTAEEAWLAQQAGRPVRTREELAALIDPTIEAEARAWLGRSEKRVAPVSPASPQGE